MLCFFTIEILIAIVQVLQKNGALYGRASGSPCKTFSSHVSERSLCHLHSVASIPLPSLAWEGHIYALLPMRHIFRSLRWPSLMSDQVCAINAGRTINWPPFSTFPMVAILSHHLPPPSADFVYPAPPPELIDGLVGFWPSCFSWWRFH